MMKTPMYHIFLFSDLPYGNVDDIFSLTKMLSFLLFEADLQEKTFS